MKKKIQKPLKLNRETITSLNGRDFREAVGMAPTDLCQPTSEQTAWTCAWVRTNCVGW